jgi:hypothetical protein
MGKSSFDSFVLVFMFAFSNFVDSTERQIPRNHTKLCRSRTFLAGAYGPLQMDAR